MLLELEGDALDMKQRAKDAFAPLIEDRARLRESSLREHSVPPEPWQALSDAGFFGAMLPAEYGGNGGGMLGAAACLEQAGRVAYGDGLPVLTTMVAIAVNAGGQKALKQDFLPRMARGEVRAAVGFTEAVSGFNLFQIQTRAVQDGDGWRIRGKKIYTSGADAADYILVVARTKSLDELKSLGLPKTMGLSLFLVDAKATGLTKTKMHCRGEGSMPTFVTEYDDVFVPDTHRIGEPDQAFMVLFQVVNPERIMFASFILGMVDHCLEVACNHARERTVFRDTPIGAYQSIQHPLADVRMRLEAVRLLARKAASAADSGADPMEAGFAANSAKYLASQLGLDAVDRAIETLGGRGFDEEYDLIHLWEMMRLFKTAPISPEMILNFVAEHTLGLPRSY